MSEHVNPSSTAGPSQSSASVGDVMDLLKDYAKQETLGPLAGAGRWLALGSLGALSLGLGLILVLLGVLRLLQTELRAFDGSFSWLAYAIVLSLCLLIAWFALSRVKKATLGKEPI